MKTFFPLLVLLFGIAFIVNEKYTASMLAYLNKNKTKELHKTWQVFSYKIFIVVFAFVFAIAVTADDKTKNRSEIVSDSESIYRKMSFGQKLATLDAKTIVNENDIKTNRLNVLIGVVSDRFNSPTDTVAEWTSKAKGLLFDKGIERSCLQILEDCNTPTKKRMSKKITFQAFITYYTMALIQSQYSNKLP